MNIKKKIKKITLILTIILTVLISTTFAKYVGENAWDYYIESNGFYFNSPQLNDSINLNNNWNGNTIMFELENYNDAGDTASSKIEYQIKCNVISSNVANINCNLNNSNSNTYNGILENVKICMNNTEDGVDVSSLDEETCKNRGYDWIDGTTSINQYFTLESEEEIKDATVEIEVVSTSPYKKTLKGQFILDKIENSTDDIEILVESYDGYEKVIVNNLSNIDRNFHLKWDSDKFRIAKDDYIIKSISSSGYIDEIEFSILGNETLTYIFYKEVSQMTESDFILFETFNDIRIVRADLQAIEFGANETKTAKISADTIAIYPDIETAQKYITYELTVHNNTEKEYIYKGIEEIELTNRNIIYKTEKLVTGTIIPPNGSITFTIKVSSIASNINGTISLKSNFEDYSEFEIYETEISGAKSTTGSYVETGYFVSSESKAIVEFTIVEPRERSVWLFSGRIAYGNQMFGVAYGSYNGLETSQESLLQFNKISYNLGKTAFEQNVRHKVEIGKDGLYFDGKMYVNPPDDYWGGVFDIYLFGNNQFRTPTGLTNGQAVIHSFVLYDQGELIIDSVPVELKDGTVHFWNKVSNTPLKTVGSLIGV